MIDRRAAAGWTVTSVPAVGLTATGTLSGHQHRDEPVTLTDGTTVAHVCVECDRARRDPGWTDLPAGFAYDAPAFHPDPALRADFAVFPPVLWHLAAAYRRDPRFVLWVAAFLILGTVLFFDVRLAADVAAAAGATVHALGAGVAAFVDGLTHA